MKKCTRCKTEKPLKDFNFKSKQTKVYHRHCRSCQSELAADWYSRNKESCKRRLYSNKKQLSLDNREKLLAYFKDHFCVDCGESDSDVLGFDHVRGKKEFDVGNKITELRWEKILAEIAKCEVRCSNCHKKRHAKERRLKSTRSQEDGQ